MKTITIEGQLRSETGKKATRRLRSEQKVPCVIYGGPDTVNFQVSQIALKNLVYTPDFQLAEIRIGPKSYRCVLKDKQFDPTTDALTHVDFLELVEDKKITINLPLKFTGQPLGVKDGGKLEVKMKTLRVKTFPKYLRENIEISTDHLELNKSVRVEDLKLDGFEILNSPRIPLASVALTRVLKQEEPVAPAAATAATAAAATPAAAAPAAAPAALAKGEKKK